ncbi:MAG: hypothetical protein K5917_07010, partial [Clostridiales bacterium]|nr:hypothetical protein [Clostridiales bacterium]
GIPYLNGRGKGDQLVVITVDVPKELNDKQKALLHEFEKEFPPINNFAASMNDAPPETEKKNPFEKFKNNFKK